MKQAGVVTPVLGAGPQLMFGYRFNWDQIEALLHLA